MERNWDSEEERNTSVFVKDTEAARRQTADGDAEAVACTAQGVDANEATTTRTGAATLVSRWSDECAGDMEVDFVRQRDTGEAFGCVSRPADSVEDGNADEEAEELGHRVEIAGTEKRQRKKDR
ncbi:hypothetical protein C8R45DRAFT_940879 [Mycena sanguinolenta]|nr:hypothetical protein C8R45DRAFT_940879 [Mycena sanguinolenta]